MMKHQWTRRLVSSLFCAVLTLVLFSAGAFAQSDKGAIGGYVRDASGAVVPGATLSSPTRKRVRLIRRPRMRGAITPFPI